MVEPQWEEFKCQSCGWATPGCYDWENFYNGNNLLPDTDCPKCGSHDSVCILNTYVKVPEDISKIWEDIHSGDFYDKEEWDKIHYWRPLK